MFNRLSAMLHQAVEALNPNIPLHEEFVRHWKIIINYFMECTDEKKPVSETKIPEHLQQMLSVLLKEAREHGETGSCMEYFLRHKILQAMATLAVANVPPGMKQCILIFITKLLNSIQRPLLPLVNVHGPIHKLLCIVGDTELVYSENEEVEFVWAVCHHLQTEPSLIDLFIQPPQRVSDVPVTPDNANEYQDDQFAASSTKSRHSLVEALVKLSRSEDSFVFERANEGLLLCTSIQSEQSATYTVLYTPFCEVAAKNLAKQFTAIPKGVNPEDILTCSAKWGGKTIMEELSGDNFSGKQQLLSFLSYLHFLDRLCSRAHQLIARAVGKAIREHFLKAIVEPRLLQASEEGVLICTTHVTRCLTLIQSDYLLREFIMFILGDNLEPERKVGPITNHLRHRIILRCDHMNDKISTYSLKLFEVLLQKSDQYILDNLIIRNIIGRTYYDLSGSVYAYNSIATLINTKGESLNPDEEYVQKVVKSFLSLMPDEAKSSDGSRNEYENYLKDANHQYTSRTIQSITWNWPKEITTSSIIDSTEEFFEGEFLSALFNKLQRVLDQPYEVNLQITSVLSLLVQFQHPYLHEYLLDPLLPLRSGSRSLFGVLQQVVNELKKRMSRIPGFKVMVTVARRQLLGNQTPNINSPIHSNLLEGTIVLEEFCKELAAIAYVKSISPLRESHK